MNPPDGPSYLMRSDQGCSWPCGLNAHLRDFSGTDRWVREHSQRLLDRMSNRKARTGPK